VVDPRHRPQVQLKVRFAELDRSKLDAFGINLFGLNSQNVGSGTTQQFSAPAFQTQGNTNTAQFADCLNLFYFNLKNGVGASLKDLQTKGILEVLAEPTLMTIDGQPAKFLAGGEFPFPVVQPGSAGGTATVTVQFRTFGVKLEFTPYVNSDGTIRLKVYPEVSALDFADVPILGQLFRYKSLNHSVMELVVVVTPTIVDPLTSDQPPPPNPKWVVPPGQLGEFDKNLPKSYSQTQQP
jgi:pilus assembly protein CpaC